MMYILTYRPKWLFCYWLCLTMMSSCTVYSSKPGVVYPTGNENMANLSQQIYTVQPGDTVSLIAQKLGITPEELIRANQLSPPYILQIGQVLNLPTLSILQTPTRQVSRGYQQRVVQSPSVSTTKQCYPPVAWQLPTEGRMVASVSLSNQRGVAIFGQAGQKIRAAATGKVIFSGDTQDYGSLIVIQHNNAFTSAYGNNRRRLVAQGSSVTVGQAIAEMGLDSKNRPVLQFEIRCWGKALDPMGFLPN